ncbi:MAG: hypothetical protein ACI86H_000868 [bacterium]|jgi:hypothetical protein
MEKLSLFHLILIVFAVGIFIILRNRKKLKNMSIATPRDITVRGVTLKTPISINTPLDCLLAEGKNYGDDFQEKNTPTLPHNKTCQCTLTDFQHKNRDWFSKNITEKLFLSDIGELTKIEKRYYKYQLLILKDTTEKKESYLDIIQDIVVSQEFKSKVEHLIEQESTTSP